MQDLLAILLALLAAGYLVRFAWRRFGGGQGGACGSCSSCGSAHAPSVRPLVSLEVPEKRTGGFGPEDSAK